MESKPLHLSAEERLYALRSLDIFHPWESVDEKRLCRRCGNIITGRQIKIMRQGWGGNPTRLECPTKGCLGVPLEWIMLDSPVQCDSRTATAESPDKRKDRASAGMPRTKMHRPPNGCSNFCASHLCTSRLRPSFCARALSNLRRLGAFRHNLRDGGRRSKVIP